MHNTKFAQVRTHLLPIADVPSRRSYSINTVCAQLSVHRIQHHQHNQIPSQKPETHNKATHAIDQR